MKRRFPSFVIIAIALITIGFLSAYVTATWPFNIREGYRVAYKPRGEKPTRPKGPYKPGGERPMRPKGPYKPGGERPMYETGGGRPMRSDLVRSQPYEAQRQEQIRAQQERQRMAEQEKNGGRVGRTGR